MNETVLVNADVNEHAEVNDIADSSDKLHTGLKVLDVHNVTASEERRGKLVTEVATGLFELADDVGEGGNAYIESFADVLNAEAVSLF